MARGGRRDRPIDRHSGPAASFVDDLRRLRGSRSLQEIGSRMGYHSSTVSRRLNPDEPPPLDFVKAYVTACGADPGPWVERWQELRAEFPDEVPGGAGRSRGRFWIVAGAVAAVVTTVVVVVTPARPFGFASSALSSSAAGPAPPGPGMGFRWKVDRMTSNLTSRVWRQAAAGTVEIWANLGCPQQASPYWIALRPGGETVEFTCGSWQHHRWERVPPGDHHFEIWKDADGRTLKGEGVLRSSTSIVEQPKASAPAR